jgi:murein tripeptide amidase MpaA
MYSWLDEQAAAHPEIASTFSIGSSFEGRDLKVLKISKPSQEPKPIIWVDANIHARYNIKL